MRLTKKEYWESSWKNIQLPAIFLSDYSHEIISKKFLKVIKDLNVSPKKIIELGGCPGRWSDFFSKKFSCRCDVLEYGENNCKITEKNYKLLGINGTIFNQDLFDNTIEKESYDVVISDGLVEHFDELEVVFGKHVELVKKGGMLIIGVPNIKQAPIYNYFAKKDEKGYGGYRIIEKEEFMRVATNFGLKIEFCDYLGVFNPGLVSWEFIRNKYVGVAIGYFFAILDRMLKIVKIRKESRFLSPYIYLICKI